MPENMNPRDPLDDFDWEELLRRTSDPAELGRRETLPTESEEPAPAAPAADDGLTRPIPPVQPAEPKPAERAEETELTRPMTPVQPAGQKRAAAPTSSAGQRKKKARARAAEPEDEFDYEHERDYLPIKPRRDGKIGLLSGLMYATFVISVSVILACMAWMFASDVLALNKPERTASVTLPKTIFTEKKIDKKDSDGKVVGKQTVMAADIDYVADQLKSAGLIEYKFLFKLYSAVSNADVKLDAGTYELSTAFDYRALVKKMTTGSPSQMTTKLTFPEGYTMEQIFSLLAENDICEKDDLYDAAANYKFSYSFIDDESLGDAKRLEGFLFPDTYEFYEGERPYSVINKFLYNFYSRYTAEMISKTEKRGLTPTQLVTVASLIEREAGDDADRGNIASVIYNRLARNMPLQIDAAIQYVLPERVPVLTEKELSVDSPYNTYTNTGLPPTPIANPGMASIRAALEPNSTNYYFYALDTATGTHRFFATYEEQMAFAATQNYNGR